MLYFQGIENQTELFLLRWAASSMRENCLEQTNKRSFFDTLLKNKKVSKLGALLWIRRYVFQQNKNKNKKGWWDPTSELQPEQPQGPQDSSLGKSVVIRRINNADSRPFLCQGRSRSTVTHNNNITERYITSHTFIFGDLAWRTLQFQILTLYNVRIRLYACMSYIKSQKPIKKTHTFKV